LSCTAAHPGQTTYSSSGLSTPLHLAGESIKRVVAFAGFAR